MAKESLYARAIGGAASFWDGWGEAFNGITDPIDDFIDVITSPKELLQDSDNNYFGIEGLSSRNIKETAANRQKRKNEERASGGGSGNPFDNRPGTDAYATASDSFVNMDEILANTVDTVEVGGATKIPFQGLLELQDIDVMGNAQELYAIAKGISPNEIAGELAKKNVGPNIFIEGTSTPKEGPNYMGPMTADSMGGESIINNALQKKYLNSSKTKETKAASEKFVDDLIKRNK